VTYAQESTRIELPGLVAGTWTIDQSHSDVSFTVRHLMVSKVRGRFTSFAGAIEIADDLLDSSVVVTVDMASVDTNDADRDVHLRASDFFAVEDFPTMTFRSTSVRREGDDFFVDGELMLRGVTRPVALAVEFNGATADPWGNTRAGFSAETEISRRDFGMEWNAPLAGGGVVVGEKVKVSLEVEAILQSS
jgi:polyisoprenoid-binding protein YceI